MTKRIISSALITILLMTGCRHADFCGNIPTSKQNAAYQSLLPRNPGIIPLINGEPDPNILFQISLDMYHEAKLPKVAHIPIAFTYFKNDTTILRIWDLKRGDLKMAKRISCVVFENAFIKECSLAFLEIEINGKEYLFVNHGE